MNSGLENVGLGFLFLFVLVFAIYFAIVGVTVIVSPAVLLTSLFGFLDKRFPALKQRKITRISIGITFWVLGIGGTIFGFYWVFKLTKNPWAMGVLLISPLIAFEVLKRISKRKPKA